MGKFSKIAMGMNVIAIIAVLVALIVNTLSYYEYSTTILGTTISYEVFYRSASAETESSGGNADVEYGECCDDADDDDDDCCDLNGRGVSWIIFLVVAMILGIIGAAADFGIAQVSFGGISNKFVPIIAGVCVLIGILIWEIDNPVYDYSDDIEVGASIWIAAVGLVFFIIGGGLEFAPDA